MRTHTKGGDNRHVSRLVSVELNYITLKQLEKRALTSLCCEPIRHDEDCSTLSQGNTHAHSLTLPPCLFPAFSDKYLYNSESRSQMLPQLSQRLGYTCLLLFVLTLYGSMFLAGTEINEVLFFLGVIYLYTCHVCMASTSVSDACLLQPSQRAFTVPV